MPSLDTDLASLAASHDIIDLGMRADAVRREKHGNKTTFLRVAAVTAAVGAPTDVAPAAGEIRIVGTPADAGTRRRARDAEVAAAAKGDAVAGFSLADLEQLAAQEKVTLREMLEELHAAGLELVAEAPFDKLQDPAAIDRGGQHRRPCAGAADDSTSCRRRTPRRG